jgi:esterase/lipase superfamily enzyme
MAAEPDRVAMQPTDPSVLPRQPVRVGEPLHGGDGSTTLPPEARPPVPIVPAPFGPGDGPRFSPRDGQPLEAVERPTMKMAVREPLEAATEPYGVEAEPPAMIREAPQPEAAVVLPEAAESAAEPSDVARSADDVGARTEAAEKPEESGPKEDENFDRVTVYYGTDRANLSEIERSQLEYLTWLQWAGVALAGTIAVAVMNLRFRRGYFLKFLLVICLLSTVGLGAWSAVRWLQTIPPELQPQFAYGGKPGDLKYGTCEVSIPKKHKKGKLESPSLIWGEFQPDPEKHVKVLDSAELSDAEFYKQLRKCVADSKRKQAFVFIHGYNVSFDDAVRRTAQLAFDLEFDGAPICYSWPSQANTFLYATDAESVVGTEDHLYEFLVGIQKKSGAERIHLIAHSMGNRCLTAVLHDMARDRENDSPPFDEIVLTAPDVRASTFRRRAPDIVKMANRVTLYASSNDAALKISQEIQTFPRAGETGKDKEGNDKIVVVDGIDTIDVSSVDTSLLGHTYYGDNTSVLSDLFDVIQFGRPAADRTWLQPKPFEDSRYWILLSERIGGRPTTENR